MSQIQEAVNSSPRGDSLVNCLWRCPVLKQGDVLLLEILLDDQLDAYHLLRKAHLFSDDRVLYLLNVKWTDHFLIIPYLATFDDDVSG